MAIGAVGVVDGLRAGRAGRAVRARRPAPPGPLRAWRVARARRSRASPAGTRSRRFRAIPSRRGASRTRAARADGVPRLVDVSRLLRGRGQRRLGIRARDAGQRREHRPAQRRDRRRRPASATWGLAAATSNSPSALTIVMRPRPFAPSSAASSAAPAAGVFTASISCVAGSTILSSASSGAAALTATSRPTTRELAEEEGAHLDVGRRADRPGERSFRQQPLRLGPAAREDGDRVEREAGGGVVARAGRHDLLDDRGEPGLAEAEDLGRPACRVRPGAPAGNCARTSATFVESRRTSCASRGRARERTPRSQRRSEGRSGMPEWCVVHCALCISP